MVVMISFSCATFVVLVESQGVGDGVRGGEEPFHDVTRPRPRPVHDLLYVFRGHAVERAHSARGVEVLGERDLLRCVGKHVVVVFVVGAAPVAVVNFDRRAPPPSGRWVGGRSGRAVGVVGGGNGDGVLRDARRALPGEGDHSGLRGELSSGGFGGVDGRRRAARREERGVQIQLPWMELDLFAVTTRRCHGVRTQ